jgi:apolipoprotein N-acyltransferase
MTAPAAALSRPLRWTLVLTAGVLMRLALGLEPVWWLVPLAPVPLLVAMRAASVRECFAMALAAALIGPVLPWPYLASLAPLPVVFGIALAMALLWSAVIVVTQLLQRRGPVWATPFAFGLSLASADVLLATVSPDGTASSLAYTQADALPVVQLASLGGTAAIVFAIGLAAAIMADVLEALRARRAPALKPLAFAGLVLIAALGFGSWRLARPTSGATLPVAAVAIDTKLLDRRTAPAAFERLLADYQAALARPAQDAAATKPRLVLLPERIADVSANDVDAVAQQLGALARAVDADVVVGLGVIGAEQGRSHNEAWWLDASGTLAARYRKQHLIQGLEALFTPGTAAAAVARPLDGRMLTLMVCKDMDFPATVGRTMQATGAAALVVPAWDFVSDGWLHSRMAVLRGVEHGVAMLRSARNGRLTISDAFGRVRAEAVSTAEGAVLIGALPAQQQPTVYATIGWITQLLWPAALALLLTMCAFGTRRAQPVGAQGRPT